MKLLAFDTSTEFMSIAVTRDVDGRPEVWQHTGAGAAQASLALIPTVLALLQQAGLTLRELDAIAFGCGPGSFTGLRTACSVAQGLAFGADLKVLPINTLWAVAEDARYRCLADTSECQITALLDARMDEIYVATYAYGSGVWSMVGDCAVMKPEAFSLPGSNSRRILAGNALKVYGERLTGVAAEVSRFEALPTAEALLRLAPALLAAGAAVAPDDALPLYIRDQVAQTTAQRAAIKAAKESATSAPAPSDAEHPVTTSFSKP
jgi:tRNA threonylcarbamoyladenosine biosynthesis protein TsaB